MSTWSRWPEAGRDPHGRVHGVAGLCVVDASIMPDIPAANTNLPTIIMIAHHWLSLNDAATVRPTVGAVRPTFATVRSGVSSR